MTTERRFSPARQMAAIYFLAFLALCNASMAGYKEVRGMLSQHLKLPVPNLQTSTKPRPPSAPANPNPYLIQIFSVQSETVRSTTAYVPGDVEQTDDTPCISSDGSDICREVSQGEKVCAANFVPMGTKLYIEGFGICTVKDRLSSRYKHRVDLAMSSKKKIAARKWGNKASEVQILQEGS